MGYEEKKMALARQKQRNYEVIYTLLQKELGYFIFVSLESKTKKNEQYKYQMQ